MRNSFAIFILLFSCILCITGIAFSIPLIDNSYYGVDSYYQPVIAALTGAVLTSGCFFFLIRRMVTQYDARHEKHEKQIHELYIESHEVEAQLNEKVHKNAELSQKQLRQELTSAINFIVAALNTLRDTIQDLVADVATIRAEHTKCDYRSGDIKLLNSQIDNCMSCINKIEKHVIKHIDEYS